MLLLVVALQLAVACATQAAVVKDWTVTAKSSFPGAFSFFGGPPQGVAVLPNTPNTTLIFSGKNCLHKAVATRAPSGDYAFRTVAVNKHAVPKALGAQGYEHVGDIDVDPSGRLVLAPLERQPWYVDPALAIFDAATLQLQNHTIVNQSHCPWVAYADSSTGTAPLVFSSEYDRVSFVYAYSWPLFESKGRVPLQRPTAGTDAWAGLTHVQGGAVRDGVLYLTTDQRVNPEGDIFWFDLRPYFAGTAPHAVFLGSKTLNVELTLAEIEGLALEPGPRGAMWVVSDLLLSPRVTTLQPVY